MSNVQETLGAKTPIGSALDRGVDTLSYQQKIVFRLYIRLVLPLDGSAFWVRAGALSESALLNAGTYNSVALGGSAGKFAPRPEFIAQGSLHYATEQRQSEDANYAHNTVIFTARQPVQDLNAAGPDMMYIATFDGPVGAGVDNDGPTGTTAIRFSFSRRGSYYQQANLWHYVGDAVYSTMDTQVVDDPATFNARELIVSNSLPAWLAFNTYDPPWPVPIPRPAVRMYPSMLVPDNMPPPFVAVHILPESTGANQTAPYFDATTSSWQLCTDRVRLTTYGCGNRVVMDIRDSLLQYSYDTGRFGICNMPAPRDAKEGQNELSTIAQKKIIDFEVSYNQGAMRDIARQLILECTPKVVLGDERFTFN